MGDILHDLLQPKKNHVSYGLRYPNQTAMELGQGEIDGQVLEDRHLGKTARIMDTGRMATLIQHTPTIIWQLQDAASPMLDDQEVHIAPTGDDVTGDGTVGAPFKTFTRALQVIENKVVTKIFKIKPASGTYTEFPETNLIDPRISGQVVIDASGLTYPVVAGPFTVGTIAGVGDINPFGNYLATDLSPTPVPSWSVDQFYGKFLHFTSGNYANQILPMWKNTEDTIRTKIDLLDFQVGDTFNVVDCPVRVEVDHPIFFQGLNSGYSSIDYLHPQLVIAGVHFKIDVGSTDVYPFLLDNISAVMTYCNIVDMWAGDNFGIPLTVQHGKLNFDFLLTGLLDNSELEGWTEYCIQVFSNAGASPTVEGIDVLILDSKFADGVNAVYCRRHVFGAGPSLYLLYSMCGGLMNSLYDYSQSVIASATWVATVFIEQIDYNWIALNISNNSVDIVELYIAKCGRAVNLYGHSFINSIWFKGAGINSAYALKIEKASSFHIALAADFSLMGTTGAIEWGFDGTNEALWPTAGNFVQKVDSVVSTKA